MVWPTRAQRGAPALDAGAAVVTHRATKARHPLIRRLGRSLIDLLGTTQHLEAVGVDLYLDQQNRRPAMPHDEVAPPHLMPAAAQRNGGSRFRFSGCRESRGPS